MGLESSTSKKEFAEPDVELIENLSYEEAVQYLKKRDVLTKVDYDDLNNKLKFRAFTASRINDGQLLSKINSALIKNVQDGKGLGDFLRMTKDDLLDKVGMGPNQGWYWETVYRTNVQTAYNAGRAMGFEEDNPLALELIVIDDARTTDYCRQFAGRRFILPYDDPFWETHWPPFHFNCRTTVRGIYDKSELPDDWSNVSDVTESPAKGFGEYPVTSDSWWKELDSQVRQAKAFGLQQEIEAAKNMLVPDFKKLKNELEGKNLVINNDVVNIDRDIIEEMSSVIDEIKVPEITNELTIAAPVYQNIASLNYKGELKLSIVYMSDKTKLIEELTTGVIKHLYPKNCNSISGFLYHEIFGHGAERFLLKYDSSIIEKEIAWRDCKVAERIVKEAVENVLKKIPGKTETELFEELCIYALESYSEIMAYGLEDVYVNKDNALLLSKEIKRVTMRDIEDMLRRIRK